MFEDGFARRAAGAGDDRPSVATSRGLARGEGSRAGEGGARARGSSSRARRPRGRRRRDGGCFQKKRAEGVGTPPRRRRADEIDGIDGIDAHLSVSAFSMSVPSNRMLFPPRNSTVVVLTAARSSARRGGYASAFARMPRAALNATRHSSTSTSLGGVSASKRRTARCSATDSAVAAIVRAGAGEVTPPDPVRAEHCARTRGLLGAGRAAGREEGGGRLISVRASVKLVFSKHKNIFFDPVFAFEDRNRAPFKRRLDFSLPAAKNISPASAERAFPRRLVRPLQRAP